MATRLAVRRSAESSKQLSVAKDKSLSAVTLTKKTNSLVSDVEELKSNLKELQVQSREAEQQDQTLQDLVAKVERLQNAFDSLSDVVIEEIDGIHKTYRVLQSKLDALDDSVTSLQDHVARVDGKRRLLQDSADRRFQVAQDTFGKFAMSLYESQSELASVKHSTEQMLTREREAAHALQRLESSHEQVAEYVQRLRDDCNAFQTELLGLKAETSGACVAIASDVQAIAKECVAVRASASQSSSQVSGKLETLREALERQAKLDRSQWSQSLDVLSENLAAHELRSKDAFATLLKSHSRIRAALDEGMSMNASELRALAHDVQTRQSEHECKLEALTEQLATHTIDSMRKHQDLEAALRVVAMA